MTCDKTNRGNGTLRVSSIAGRSVVVHSCARDPLRLLTPRSRGLSTWAYMSTFGGGMVAGDATRLTVQVDRGARCFLSTQASTKIYRNPQSLPCTHSLSATLAEEAVLIVAPDPVQCFAESRYEQHQEFHLSASSTLVLVDWMSAGRTARGERWAFSFYSSRNEIRRDGKLVMIDATVLDAKAQPLNARFRAGRFNCFASVVLLGPKAALAARQAMGAIDAQPIAPKADLLITASPLREGAFLRFAGTHVEQVGNVIQKYLSFVAALLEDDPWVRKF